MLLDGADDSGGAEYRPGTGGGRTALPGAAPSDERYLSVAALQDACGALRGLAETLLRVGGPFTADAAVDADRLNALADVLSTWCPHATPGSGRPTHGLGHPGGSHWAGLLSVYFRQALAPGRVGSGRPA